MTDEERGGGESIAELRNDPPLRWMSFGFSHPVYRLVVWMFVLGSACHLWLADAWQIEWLAADIFYILGLIVLAWGGAWPGWVLSGLGLAIPLLFHRDQLTQSMFLLLVSVVGAVTVGYEGWRRVYGEDEGNNYGEEGRAPGASCFAFLRTVQWLTILVYGFAFLHKLNADFLDPHYSCAVYGLREVTAYWSLPPVEIPAVWAVAVPLGVLVAEGAVAGLHLMRFRRVAWTLAIAFHIFLTFTMAPAFVFVMLVGHAAFARRADIDALRRCVAEHWMAVGGFALVVTSSSLWLHGSLPELTMIPREFALWGLLAALVAAFPPWQAAAWVCRPVRRPTRSVERWLPATVAIVFAFNCLTPYLGLQFQHTAAMVSNLRIDRGCWNSLVFPESLRLRDEYIRVDEVYFGEPGRDPRYEKIVREQLWSPPQFRQMRRNWCSPSNRPFYLRGRYLGESFEIEDLCAGKPLPFGELRLFGAALFGDFLRFQKNLMRECPQTCIH